jgi:PAS domain S-box-containing protein
MSYAIKQGLNIVELRMAPAYAQFLLDHHLEEVSAIAIDLALEMKLPLMQYLQHLPGAEIRKISVTGWLKFLRSMRDNDLQGRLEEDTSNWLSNQLPNIEREQVALEDITKLSYVRKQAMLKFMERYTSDLSLALSIAEEIDAFMTAYVTAHVHVFVNIIQEREQSHIAELEQSEALNKHVQAIAHIGNYVWDLEKHFVVWSDELFNIYELSPTHGGVINNSDIRPYNHPDDDAVVHEHIRVSLETLKPFDFYYRIVLKEGRVKTLRARGEIITTDEGKPVKVIGTAQDVTEQKNVEDELLRNQNFIKKIADATPAVIASYNVRTGSYTFINKALFTLLGYQPEQPLTEGVSFFTSIVHPDDLPDLMAKNQRALEEANAHPTAQEPIVEFQYRMRHSNGDYRWFHTFGTIFDRTPEGHVQHVLNISLDITERIKVERMLYQQSNELQQSNARLEEFAFITSHDLKEPLRKIVIFSDRLMRMGIAEKVPGSEAIIDKIISASLRMQQMVMDLLSLSQLSGDKRFETVSLQQLLEEALQSLEHKIEETKAIVTFNSLPEARVVSSQFRQMFQNLLNNSLKFSKPGTAPEIHISHQWMLPHELPETHHLKEGSAYLQLTFKDNGIGFDNVFADRIFAIFQRLHSKDEYDGTGIGLAICKKVMENHGGIITAQGTVNDGASFTLLFPHH